MEQRTVIELLALKLSGEATQEDLLELDELIAKNPDSVYHSEVITQLFQQKNEEHDTESSYNRHRLKYQHKLVFAEETISVSNSLKSFKPILAVCCLLFILTLSTLFVYNYKKQTLSANYNTKIVSEKTVRKNLVLPDGTKVWLNAGSTLLYDKDINERDVRSVKLIGEAFFDVTHNNRPFIINTAQISISVLGTAFNVKAYPSEKTTEATLLRGSIELSVNNKIVEKILLKPSEKFALTDNKKITIEKISPVEVEGQTYTEEVSWMDDKLVFKNESFEKLIPRLERKYNIKLEVQRNEINDYHFTGVFTNEDLTQVLTAMKIIKHFNFKIKDNDVILY